jgi:SAM-dependent methyltransferase
MPESEQSQETQDPWAAWLLLRRHGGDAQARQAMLDGLAGVRDTVLDNGHVAPSETLLDVGCGDGLIAFGALERVGPQGIVIFSDISQDLLDHCQAVAREMGHEAQCRFVRAAADDLGAFADASVDIVTTRSVLIYVKDKRAALREFYRVLRPGGRLSLFEPINRFAYPELPERFMGYDVAAVQDVAQKVLAAFARLSGGGEVSMLDFDDRDLLAYAEQAGFPRVVVETRMQIVSYPEAQATRKAPKLPETVAPSTRWETVLRSAPNPLAPTLEEAMAAGLTPDEAERFTAHLRPLVEAHRRVERSAVAYLRAEKGGA